ncbi:MAG: septal ring lytic transglycosylase RlpA family protein [Hyphomicrobiales bacterium]
MGKKRTPVASSRLGLPFKAGALASMLIVLASCSGPVKQDPFAGIGSPKWTGSGPPPKGGGRPVIGEPYQVAGEWFYPKEDPTYDKVGVASWYGEAFDKRMTANGEWFDMNYLSAAHATLPLPSYVKVTNLENGKSIVVRVNDRGPFVSDRLIDVSKQAAHALDFHEQGTTKVRVQYIGPASVDDKGQELAAMNRRLGQGGDLAAAALAIAPTGARP